MTATLDATTVGTIAAVGSAVIPPVVSLLKREHWSAQVKQAIAGLASIVVAVVGIALTVHNWSALNLTTLAALAYAGSQLVYGVYFRGSVVETRLTSLGSKNTTVETPPVVTTAPVAA